MPSSEYDISDPGRTESRPDKSLVVKCTYDEAVRKITFPSTRVCSYELLRRKIEESFSLYATSFAITYTDDDGEVTDISTDIDLTEAIRYVYPVHDDPPVSSSSSILSGRSFTRGKITLRVRITVEYDGPSLSDTSSLVSLDEYRNRNGSEFSLSLSARPEGEVDDDSITVSSKDMGSKYDVHRPRGPRTVVSGASHGPSSRSPIPSVKEELWEGGSTSDVPPSDELERAARSNTRSISERDPFSDKQATLDPSSVFERLRLEEEQQSGQLGSSYGSSTLHSERGAAWLRDQNARTIKGMLGELPAPSEVSYESSIAAPEDAGSVLSGELALQQDSTGKYYYAYTAGSSYAASQSVPDSGFEDTSDIFRASITANPALSRPTSMEVNGQEFRDTHGADLHRSSTSASNPFSVSGRRSYMEPIFPADYIDPDVPPEVLQFITGIPPTPPENPPKCSNCGVILDAIRYVCSSCGEKRPVSPQVYGAVDIGKGKDRATEMEFANGKYSIRASPPTTSSASSSSSWSMVSDAHTPLHSLSDTTLSPLSRQPKPLKPLPAIPTQSNDSSFSQSSLTIVPPYGLYAGEQTGYELCWQCLASAGVTHALEMSVAPGSSPSLSEWPSTEDAQRAMSQWRRSAPSQKGQLRHAYIEKSWGHRGWQDVEQDDHLRCMCSTCGTQIVHHRYKCASCENFNLCKACYSQVHEIHPSHAFLIVPDKAPRSRSEPSLGMSSSMTIDGEPSLKHLGVQCMHCMQDIVGARFHCAICESVDICSNCESAGLPGNLHESDGGHSSSHIMIKIPYPLPNAELQSASQRAKSLWSGRDAATGQPMRPRRNSLLSSYDRTVLGTGARSPGASSMNGASMTNTDDHGMRCDACNKYIVGIRYQCASCPSLPKPYSLCTTCEERSYVVHDPMHVFIKFPRPLDHSLQVDIPLVPRLYQFPAGPRDGRLDLNNPKAYMVDLWHSFAFCDRCMTKINGEWYRCGYCSIDLCEVCHRMDTHNDTHAFVVFKSVLDIVFFKRFTSDVNDPLPIIPYPIYDS